MRELLALAFMVRTDRRSWVPAIAWGMAAAVSVTVAVVVAVQPGHLGDLHQLRAWLVFFQEHDADIYAHFAGELDYPPIALLVLLPIGLIPDATLAYWFLPASLAVTILAGWAFVRAIADRLYVGITPQELIALVALLLSSSGVRTSIWVGQTVSLAVLSGALALYWSRRRPYAAALALAVCSFKPHLAAGFGLAILLIDGLDVPLIAAAIVISLSLLVAAAIDQSILALAANYAHNLGSLYDGPDRIRGLLSIRWIFDDLIGNYWVATVLYAAAATLSLVIIGALVRRADSAAERTQIIAAVLLWPLLFLPSQLYNSLMAAPAVWLLMWPEGRLVSRESARLAAVTVFTLIGVLDVPRLARLAAELSGGWDWLYTGSYYVQPLRLSFLLGFILFVLIRGRRQESGVLP